MAFQAVTKGPYSVDTFFFIGATLVSYLLLKVMMVTTSMWLPSQPGSWQDKRLAQPEGFCPHGVLLHEQVLFQNLLSPSPWSYTWSFMIFDITFYIHCTGCSALASLMVCSSSSWLGCLRPNFFQPQPKIMIKCKNPVKSSILTGASSDHYLPTICSPVCSGRGSTMR